jgi:hypothetical protein
MCCSHARLNLFNTLNLEPSIWQVKGNIALSEARLIFNLSNEPAYKYSLAVVADRAPDAKVISLLNLKPSAPKT